MIVVVVSFADAAAAPLSPRRHERVRHVQLARTPGAPGVDAVGAREDPDLVV